MKIDRHLVQGSVLCLAAIASSQAFAVIAAEEHAAHHAAVAASQPPADAAKFSDQMARMHEMHQKMQAAKTPEERAALMGDHMKAMQDGMSMMGHMPGCMAMQGGAMGEPSKRPRDHTGSPMSHGDMSAEHEAMHHRMDMMEMMMQMMLDRQVPAPAVTK